jgi:hypothetical protein
MLEQNIYTKLFFSLLHLYVLEFPLYGTFSDKELGMMDRQYSQILDYGAAFMSDDLALTPQSLGPNTRSAIRPSTS